MKYRDAVKHPIFYYTLLEDSWTWTPEHKGIPGRKFAFDYACIKHKVAIEIDGGIWRGSQGGHTSGTGKMRDMEKDREAILAAWVVARFAPNQGDELRDFLRRVKVLKESQVKPIINQGDHDAKRIKKGRVQQARGRRNAQATARPRA